MSDSKQSVKDIVDNVLQYGQDCYLAADIHILDVMKEILRRIGKARVTQTTFSISEELINRIRLIKEEGLLESITMVLDYKATQKTISIWQFIDNVVDEVLMSEIHAKTICIENDEYRIVVFSSQNNTRGNRLEATMITMDRRIYAKFHESLKAVIEGNAVPLKEEMAEKIELFGEEAWNTQSNK